MIRMSVFPLYPLPLGEGTVRAKSSLLPFLALFLSLLPAFASTIQAGESVTEPATELIPGAHG